MASCVHGVELILEGLVSLASQGLQEIDLQENFHIMKELGGGGYGSVLLVKDRKTDQRMALKILERSRTTEGNFLMEFSMSSFLSSHPNIIINYGIAFKTCDHFAFAQELAPIGDLFNLIPPNRGLPEDMVKRCAVQISSALQFIESKGLVHLDIKPENVLVFDEECHCIKITDFGLARVKGTVIHVRSGSVPYMTPEMCQLTDKDGLIVDSTLDVWAFAVVLYCLLTGEFPWQAALPTDKEYSKFVEWENDFRSDDPPSPFDRLPSGVLDMFSHLLAIDCKPKSRSTDIFVFMSGSWKVEMPTGISLDDVDNTFSGESEFSYADQTSFLSTNVSTTPTDTSHSSESIMSVFSSMSGHFTSYSSGSECEEPPYQWQHNTPDPLTLMDEERSFHVRAEVEIG